MIEAFENIIKEWTGGGQLPVTISTTPEDVLGGQAVSSLKCEDGTLFLVTSGYPDVDEGGRETFREGRLVVAPAEGMTGGVTLTTARRILNHLYGGAPVQVVYLSEVEAGDIVTCHDGMEGEVVTSWEEDVTFLFDGRQWVAGPAHIWKVNGRAVEARRGRWQ